MKSDHRTVYQKFCENKGKFCVLSKVQDDKLQICKVQRWEIPFPQSSKKVIMTSSFDKNNLGKELFALERGIHCDKRTRGIRTITESILRKEF